ncbi:Eco57I restriction-modification methylase domain-containing protein [Candidatus Saccharibacteria bacterium]|nr:Eco57I restriction-modification methylase domain-containing protein [Candidatus Saccharibacteria bacterium]
MKEFEIKPVRQKIIYVYKHPDSYRPHIGWLKIGDQTGLDSTRIDDQNEADNIETETLFQVPAVDIYGKTFRDYDIHKALEFMGIPREKKVNNSNRKSEWFKVDLETVKKVIDDRIKCHDFFNSYIPSTPDGIKPKIVLRKEQQDAVDMTYEYWLDRAGNPDRDFLWNAKPRFGKTLTAYNFAMKTEAKRILIVTNRPAISDSWARDFYEHIRPEHPEYVFSSAKGGEVKTSDGKVFRIPSRQDVIGRMDDLRRPLIFFISLQDIKGKSADSDDFKKKNQWIFDIKTRWDLLIIDESHEGVKTSKTKEVLDKLGADFTLCLSGTPFKAIASNDFSKEQIFNWSYADEQESKANWDYEKGDNPYENLPRMNFRAYHMSTMMEATVDDEEACFDLSEFFKTSGKNFLRPGDVVGWLDKISGISRNEETGETFSTPADASANMPFDTEEKRDALRHTFWLLPGVAECEAMKDLLKSHPVFKDYEVVLAAGKGDDEQEGKKSLDKVRNAIGNEPLKTKTITLSCGQLNTGVTVPEWTAVFMLYGSTGTGQIVRSSSTQYLQAAFRAQNPWVYGEHKEFSKDDCYIFDFAPDRVLTILGDYAVKLTDNQNKNQDHKPAIRKLLNYLSVISMDEKGEMRELDARDVVELPRKLIAKEIVDGGFITSNKLFNINNIFHATPEARQIINKLTAVKKQRLEKTPSEVAETETEIDEEGNTIIDNEVLINTSEGVLRKKEYEVLTEDDRQAALQAAFLPEETPLPDDISDDKREVMESAVKEIKQEAKKQAEKKRKKEEDEYRDKLRGFARTIPMLLHAYGQPGMTFDDLEKKIPDDIFFELTDITKDEFRILRKEQYFNEDNCTVAIKEFMKREEELADYFCIGADRDIFDYIPMQRNNQVFTPKKVVAKMLDTLEEEVPSVFKSDKRKFLDPYSKSGLFLAGVVKRLYNNLRPHFKSDRECLMHILSNQIYAWSPNDILRKSSINTIIGFTRFDRDNFDQKDKRGLERNFLSYDPMNEKGEIENDKVQQKIDDCWEENMKFDIIIGNPPYQLGYRQIYADFYRMAVDLNPQLLCMIFPIGWQKANNTNGLKQLNNEHYKRDRHIVSIDNYYEDGPDKIFPDVGTGGVNIILRNSNYDNNGEIKKFEYGKNVGTFVLPIEQSEMEKPAELKAMLSVVKSSSTIDSLGSSQKPYGLRTDAMKKPEKYGLKFTETKTNDDDVRAFGLLPSNKRGYMYISRDILPKTSSNLDHYKLFVPKAWGNMSKTAGIGGSYSNLCIANPGDVCLETYMEFGAFKTKEETEKMAKYFFTKFFRALLFLAKDSQCASKEKYKFIPIPDLAKGYWSKSIAEIDEILFEEYNIPEESRRFIRENIQTRDESNIDIL